MKLLLLVLCSLSVSAISIETVWNQNFSKELIVNCEESSACSAEFGETTTLSEEICDDCFSTDLSATFIFNGIGESISTGQAALEVEFFEFLKDQKFVSIDFDTPYDLVTNQSRIKKKLAYRALCEDSSIDPVLFFDVDQNGGVSSPRFILSGDGVYELDLFAIDLHDDFFGTPELY